jgi:hypothetical protein
MVRRVLRAMVGLPDQRSTDDGLVYLLIENSWNEVRALGGWIATWAVTGALLVISGYVVHTASPTLRRQVVTIAAILMAISVLGVLIHAARAAIAVSSSQNLAVKKRPATSYDRAVAWLTTPTPWVLAPQVLLGIATGVFGASQTVYR